MKKLFFVLAALSINLLEGCKPDSESHVIQLECFPSYDRVEIQLENLASGEFSDLALSSTKTIELNSLDAGQYKLFIDAFNDTVPAQRLNYDVSFSVPSGGLSSVIDVVGIPKITEVEYATDNSNSMAIVHLERSSCGQKSYGTYYYLSTDSANLYTDSNQFSPDLSVNNSQATFQMNDTVLFFGVKVQFYEPGAAFFAYGIPQKLDLSTAGNIGQVNPVIKLDELFEFDMQLGEDSVFFTEIISDGLYSVELLESNNSNFSGSGLFARLFGITDLDANGKEGAAPSLVMGLDNYFHFYTELKDATEISGTFGLRVNTLTFDTVGGALPLNLSIDTQKSFYSTSFTLQPGFYTVKSYQPAENNMHAYYYMRELNKDYWFVTPSQGRLERVGYENLVTTDTLFRSIEVNETKTFEVFVSSGYYGDSANFYFDLIKN